HGWEDIDIIVHSAAFAPSGQLDGDFLDDVTREGFRVAHDVSCLQLRAPRQGGLPMLREGGSLLTMTCLGAVRAVSHYGVMGLAKATLTARVRYLAAASLGPRNLRGNAVSAGHHITAMAVPG
ncbi:MAG: SDR family oxidoreductase, partial [Hydrogenophaga sp.]